MYDVLDGIGSSKRSCGSIHKYPRRSFLPGLEFIQTVCDLTRFVVSNRTTLLGAPEILRSHVSPRASPMYDTRGLSNLVS